MAASYDQVFSAPGSVSGRFGWVRFSPIDRAIDLMLEASWGSGRTVRDYSLAVEPPAEVAKPDLPVPAAEAATRSATGPVASEPEARAASVPELERGASVPVRQVNVVAGDSASKIALANKPVEIALDQMLVAMLQANPRAFSGGNVNRLMAGAVLRIPSPKEAAAVPLDQATQMVLLQAKNFDEYRRKLAASTREAQGASRSAANRLDAIVVEAPPAASSRQRLRLSGAAVGSVKGDAIAAGLAREVELRAQRLSKEELEVTRLINSSGSPPTAGRATVPQSSSSAAPAQGSSRQ